MSPRLKAALVTLVAAVAAALTAYLQGCSPSVLEKADSALDALDCVRDVRRHNDALLRDPESVTLESGKQLAVDLKACLPESENADAGPDSGAR